MFESYVENFSRANTLTPEGEAPSGAYHIGTGSRDERE